MKLTTTEKFQLAAALAKDVFRNIIFGTVGYFVGSKTEWYVGLAAFLTITFIYAAIITKNKS